MKTEDPRTAAGHLSFCNETAESRMAALERLIAYARDEAERLKADVLVFCLDASLSVARGELQGRDPIIVAKAHPPGRRKLRH